MFANNWEPTINKKLIKLWQVDELFQLNRSPLHLYWVYGGKNLSIDNQTEHIKNDPAATEAVVSLFQSPTVIYSTGIKAVRIHRLQCAVVNIWVTNEMSVKSE